MRSFTRFTIVLLVILLTLVSKQPVFVVLALDSGGNASYQDGLQLFRDQRYDQAARMFWKAILQYQQGSSSYQVNEAMQQLLLCYHKQGNLALGYAFVARQMFNQKDSRALDFLRMAHEIDSTHPEIVQLMTQMGETASSIVKRRYSPEEEEEDVSTCRQQDGTCQAPNSIDDQGELVSGWDMAASLTYQQISEELTSSIPTITVDLPFLDKTIQVAENPFWSIFNTWEAFTLEIFRKYITNETIVIDFGTWIGPTMLYHAQFSKKSYGMEADPVAFATMQYNAQLNAPTLGSDKMHVEPVAVAAPQDVGPLQMSSKSAGNSGSGIARQEELGVQKWSVNGYSLPYILRQWNVSLHESPVFIKIDIESYECRLVPSFHDWILLEKQQSSNGALDIVIFVSFHPQLRPCTKSQMKQVLQVFQLFDKVYCMSNQLSITSTTSFEEFETMLDQSLTNKDDSDFLLVMGDKVTVEL